MHLFNTKDSYGFISRLLHWGMAILILGMLGIGFVMTGIEEFTFKMKLYNFHKAIDLTLFLLVILRLFWKLKNITPNPSKKSQAWQISLSKININLLYIMMFLMPISGMLMSLLNGYEINYFDFFKITPLFSYPTFIGGIARELHVYSAYGLVVLLTFHILAVFYHYFILKENILRRISY